MIEYGRFFGCPASTKTRSYGFSLHKINQKERRWSYDRFHKPSFRSTYQQLLKQEIVPSFLKYFLHLFYNHYTLLVSFSLNFAISFNYPPLPAPATIFLLESPKFLCLALQYSLSVSYLLDRKPYLVNPQVHKQFQGRYRVKEIGVSPLLLVFEIFILQNIKQAQLNSRSQPLYVVALVLLFGTLWNNFLP